MMPHPLVMESPSSSQGDALMGPDPPAADPGVVELLPSIASWVLSSAKPGNGVNQLMDNNLETYWQSDGPLPHLLTITFNRKTKLSDLWIHFNHRSDESYTPQQLSIRIGTGYHDLEEIQIVDLNEPQGWLRVPLVQVADTQGLFVRDKSFGGAVGFIRVWCLQIAVIGNHQNGRDTHVRQIKLFGPRAVNNVRLTPLVHPNGTVERVDVNLKTAEMLSMITIR